MERATCMMSMQIPWGTCEMGFQLEDILRESPEGGGQELPNVADSSVPH